MRRILVTRSTPVEIVSCSPSNVALSAPSPSSREEKPKAGSYRWALPPGTYGYRQRSRATRQRPHYSSRTVTIDCLVVASQAPAECSICLVRQESSFIAGRFVAKTRQCIVQQILLVGYSTSILCDGQVHYAIRDWSLSFAQSVRAARLLRTRRRPASRRRWPTLTGDRSRAPRWCGLTMQRRAASAH